jgi:6-phosphofructokinase 1
MSAINHIGVLTTGGDAPGMNAVIRAVVRSALDRHIRVSGIERGYCGLLEGDLRPLDSRSVGGIINRGGTVLHTVRCPQFEQLRFRKQAYTTLQRAALDALIVIGGNGSAAGAYTIHREAKLPVAVVPASIDNDIYGTEETVGFDTALNTAVDAIDKIRDTASSHERIFLTVVMGREHGFIAQEVGLCCGAEAVLVPEIKYDVPKICRELAAGHKRGKLSSIIVMAEGAGDSRRIAAEIEKRTGSRVWISVLGYIQRGGNPTARSRWLAARMGNLAVKALAEGHQAVLTAIQHGRFLHFPLSEAVRKQKRIDRVAYQLAYQLAK